MGRFALGVPLLGPTLYLLRRPAETGFCLAGQEKGWRGLNRMGVSIPMCLILCSWMLLTLGVSFPCSGRLACPPGVAVRLR